MDPVIAILAVTEDVGEKLKGEIGPGIRKLSYDSGEAEATSARDHSSLDLKLAVRIDSGAAEGLKVYAPGVDPWICIVGLCLGEREDF